MRRLSGLVFLQRLMEDFSKAPGGKDLSKVKTQYDMFVDAVDSKQATV